jgi:tetratricopeptide (TPR) repeat protein
MSVTLETTGTAIATDCLTATLDALPPRFTTLPRGATVGRYLVLDAVGAGGMGVVYAAYDPEFDRRIALKIVRPRGDRLLCEAQAAARLSHPNVVAVHDAGSFGDQVFLAMELVDGQTLRQWLAEEERGWREIVRVFTLAGRGLAAAHAAGLVHRDFKPENVLVGKDGQVRVADFGLARPEDDTALAEPWDEGLRTAGTPAYMAPEQRRGAADARSDQFSFCVALWEALAGTRPVSGAAGELRPAWLRQVLLRGLQADPAARHPSMEALLAALTRDPAAVWRRLAAAAVVLAAVGAATAGVWTVRDRERMLCGGGDAQAAAAWDGARRTAVRAAFLRTGVPFAASAWMGVDRALAAYTRSWAAQRREACAATRLRGEQSEALLDRRMLCLDQRLGEARALADLFSRADRQVVQRAVQATGALGDLAECSDVAALAQRIAPPRDPALRLRVDAARAHLAAVKALQAAGKYPQALAAARSVEREAARLPYRPVQAEALFAVGDLLENTGDFAASETTLQEALWAAEESRDDLLRAKGLKKLAYTVGYRQGRPAEALRFARGAHAVLRRAGGPPRLEGALLNTEGALLMMQNRLGEALSRYRQALALAERGGADDPEAYATLTDIGGIYERLGKGETSLSYHQRALALAGKKLGPDHPVMASVHANVGMALMSLGRMSEAEPHFRRSLEIRAALLGPDHPDLAESLNALGVLWIETGRPDRALPYLQRAERIYARTLATDSPFLAMARNNVGEALRKMGRYREALDRLEPALRALDASDEARVFAANLLNTIGEVHLDRGAPAAAIAPLERALGLFLRMPNPSDTGHVLFDLARALWESNRDRGRALALARQARADLAAAGAEGEGELAALEAWLKGKAFTP